MAVDTENVAFKVKNLLYDNPSLFISAWHYNTIAILFLDIIAIIASFLVAYYIRFDTHILPLDQVFYPDVSRYYKGAAILTSGWIFLMWRDSGYEDGLQSIEHSFVRFRLIIVSGFYSSATLLVVSVIYNKKSFLSGVVFIMTALFASAAMILVRRLFRDIEQRFAKNGITTKRVAIVGMNEVTMTLATHMRDEWPQGHLAGHILWSKEEQGKLFEGKKILGNLDQIHDVYKNNPFDILIMPSPEMRYKNGKRRGDIQGPGTTYSDTIMKIVNFCEENNIYLYMLPGSYEIAVSRYEIGSFAGTPVIRLRDSALKPIYAIVKRCMDICVSLGIIIIGMPLWPIIAVLIKLTDKGPVFFIQTRAGLHEEPFRMIKFRTMVLGAEEQLKDILNVEKLSVPGFKIKNDPRVTKFGRFLRRTSLDEIPQLINVLKGEMSLVGPRPEMMHLVARYSTEQRRRLKAKPGITGYLQIKARGIPLASGVKYDLTYLKHQSLLFDLYILMKTIWVVFVGRGTTH